MESSSDVIPVQIMWKAGHVEVHSGVRAAQTCNKWAHICTRCVLFLCTILMGTFYCPKWVGTALGDGEVMWAHICSDFTQAKKASDYLMIFQSATRLL